MFGRSKKEDKETTIDLPVEEVDIPEANTTEAADVIDTVDAVKEEPEVKEPPPLTIREAKYLKRSRYETKIRNNPIYKKMFVIENKRTGQIVQLRASTAYHACNIIGWKARKVRVIMEEDIPDPQEAPQADAVEIKEIKRDAIPETTASA